MPIALAAPSRRHARSDRDTVPDTDTTLEGRIADVLDRARPFVDLADLGAPGHADPDDQQLAALTVALRALLARPGTRRAAEVMDVAFAVQELRHERQQIVSTRRARALEAVEGILARPLADASVEKLLEHATMEACRSCGFDRAMLFVVDGSRLVAHSTYFRGHDGWAAECHQVARDHVPGLAPHLLETEMIRRRKAALMLDPMEDERAFRPIIHKIETSGYVAAPIMPEGRVIATIHCDAHFSGRRVDAIDRDSLAAFAAGLGSVLERRVLAERLVDQRDQLRSAFQAADDAFTAACEAPISVGPAARRSTTLASVPSPEVRRNPLLATPSRAESLLSRRELEVLRLLATGATNAAIADQLVLSEGTVKSHVKRILRKLRATNRAEAVSKFLRLEGGMAAADEADALLRD